MLGRKLLMLCMFSILGACGGGGTETPKDAFGGGGQKTTIVSYIISGNKVNNEIVINTANFNIDWKVTSSKLYNIRYYLSKDNIFSEKTDKQFISLNCGSNGGLSKCANTGTANCSFSQMKFACDIGQASGPVTITSVANSIPGSYFIIAKACDSLFNSCPTKAIAVNLL